MTKGTEGLACKIDAFEFEMHCVCVLIDTLYKAPQDYQDYAKILEILHTHKSRMNASYESMREDLFVRLL